MRALALLLLAACGDSAVEAVDAGPPADGGDYPVDRVGLVNLIEAGEGGSAGWLAVYASILDQAERPQPFLKAAEGDCAVYVRPAEELCDPACTLGRICLDGACVAGPSARSAGRITVTGLLEDLTFEPLPTGYSSPAPPDDLFAPGASVRVSAPGDAHDGFDVTLSAPASLVAPFQNLSLVDGEDATVTWTAANDARIQVALLVGWHGRPWEAMLLCETDDDGSLTIPGSLISKLPRASTGLESHTSSLMRFRRALVPGPVEILVGSHHNLYFSHP